MHQSINSHQLTACTAGQMHFPAVILRTLKQYFQSSN